MDLYMASINTSSGVPACDDQLAWNQAYDRIHNFLNAFALSDHAQVSRLALKILDQAREIHQQDTSRDPTILVMEQAQKLVSAWLKISLDDRARMPQQIFTAGYVAMLLNQTFRTSPIAFLVFPLPEHLRQSMHQTLVVTGPDLDISSMTPRPIDYGPMVEIAHNTWHQWNARSIFIAMLFWTGIYFVAYLWISYFL